MGGGNTSPSGADVQRFGELDELGARGVRAAHKDRNLELNARRASWWKVVQALAYLGELGIHDNVVS